MMGRETGGGGGGGVGRGLGGGGALFIGVAFGSAVQKVFRKLLQQKLVERVESLERVR
jgi:hypothetical protein